jgi:hypothetical protein
MSDRQPIAGLAVAALGVLASTVGMDPLTDQPRYPFGRLELWDGLETISVIGGLFVIPEMLALARNTESVRSTSSDAEFRRMVAGMGMTFRHNVILLRSTVIGILVGIMPGAGSSVAVWISYADAARRGSEAVPFGSGAIAGVVAPEAANNAKEGGVLIPTLLFGVPEGALLFNVVFFVVLSTIGLTFFKVEMTIARARTSDTDLSAGKEKMTARSIAEVRTIDVGLDDFALGLDKRTAKGKKLPPKTILHPINATFQAGVLNVIMGPSGSGKTSLLNSMALRLRNSLGTKYRPSGKLTFNGASPSDSVIRSVC